MAASRSLMPHPWCVAPTSNWPLRARAEGADGKPEVSPWMRMFRECAGLGGMKWPTSKVKVDAPPPADFEVLAHIARQIWLEHYTKIISIEADRIHARWPVHGGESFRAT